MMGVLQEILHLIVEFAILIFEYIGVGVILCAGIRGILNYIRRNPVPAWILPRDLPWDWNLNLAARSYVPLKCGKWRNCCL